MRRVLSAACLAGSAAAADAATLSVQTFSRGAAVGALTSDTIETFDGFVLGESLSGFDTAVGRFTSLGGVGTGSSVTGSGAGLAVRDGSLFGRTAVSDGQGAFLDSNDTFGVRWEFDGPQIDAVSFILTDAGDVGGELSIILDGVVLGVLDQQRSNGVIDLVTIMFDAPRATGRLDLRMNQLNDGFAVDSVGVSPAVVPLPAAGALSAFAVFALWIAARRRSRA